MLFRKFEPKDAEEVSSLIRRSILTRNNTGYSIPELYAICNHYSKDTLLSNMNEKHTLVCIDKEKIIGTCSLKGEEAMALFIDPEYQGLGLGTQFMEMMEKEAVNRRIKKIWGVAALS